VKKMLLIKVPEEVNRYDFEKEIISKFHIPKEFILVIDIESKEEKKKIGKELRKIIKKSKSNAKYLEETTPIEKISKMPYFPNTGIY
jgi:hypothetical protein